MFLDLAELEVIVNDLSKAVNNNRAVLSNEGHGPTWANAIALLVWLVAGVVPFLPFALDTSPLDAVALRVPGNQGNWWHLLAGAPFFLAYPMIWLRLRSIHSSQPSTAMGRRLVWSAVVISILGTILVEMPFLLHLAGTSEWQRLSVLSLGFGIMVASAVILLLRPRHISPTRACVTGLDTAYLANAALCLVAYSGATGRIWSRSGWYVAIVIVWPMLIEVIWFYIEAFRTPATQINPRAA